MVLNQGWLSAKTLFYLTGQGLWMIILYWIPDLIPGQITAGIFLERFTSYSLHFLHGREEKKDHIILTPIF
jgi:hypothetical protein